MLALLMRIAVEGAAIAHPAPVVDADMARPAPVVDRAITACDPMLRQTGARNARPGGMLDRSRDAGEAPRSPRGTEGDEGATAPRYEEIDR